MDKTKELVLENNGDNVKVYWEVKRKHGRTIKKITCVCAFHHVFYPYHPNVKNDDYYFEVNDSNVVEQISSFNIKFYDVEQRTNIKQRKNIVLSIKGKKGSKYLWISSGGIRPCLNN